MSGISAELIGNLVEELVANYKPQQVILFGSYAYGTPNSDSDVDLLIVKDTDLPGHERSLAAREAMGRLSAGIPMDLLVMTPGEIKVRLAKGDQFIEDIVREGQCLYGEAAWIQGGVNMPPAEPNYVAEWLTNSERDLRRAGLLLNDEDAGGAGFHLQQALEKALKAFLLHHGWRLQRSHDLEMLLETALAFDAELENLRYLCRRVSGYYLADRYPDSGNAIPSLAEVGENLAVTRALVARVRQFIGG